jgi:hypothetical protein
MKFRFIFFTLISLAFCGEHKFLKAPEGKQGESLYLCPSLPVTSIGG